MTIFLGIDPGSRTTGFGVIHVQGQTLRHIASGCIRMKQTTMSARLQHIFNEVCAVVAEYAPDEAAIERVFMHINPGGALVLGQARGAAIVAIAQASLPVAEYAATEIKQAVVGYGAADKQQVQHMVRSLLQLTVTPPADAADALAVAICHAHSKNVVSLLNQQMKQGELHDRTTARRASRKKTSDVID